jgi:hypothetical protein
MSDQGPSLSSSTIEVMKLMAADQMKSQALVQDSVCLGGLVMVLSNSDLTIVCAALETLLKLAEWPNLRTTLRDFLGVRDQLSSLMLATSPIIQNMARRVYSLLYCPNPFVEPALDASIHRNEAVSRRRRNSFFVSSVSKAKTVVLQIRGLNDKDDMDICRSSLLTVSGVISITFNLKQKRAIIRTKQELRPELLAKAVSRTMTMSAEQVIRNDHGMETFVSFNIKENLENSVELPDYPSDVDSPVSGNQNLVRHGSKHSEAGGTWGFLHTLGNIISNSLYW